MTTLIKIKRSSIKKNPDAYTQSYHLVGSTEATGTYKGQLPKWLNDKVIITSGSYPVDNETEFEFVFTTAVDKDTVQRISKDKNATLTITNNYVDVQCGPQSKYLYQYTNPLIQCDNCNSKVRFKDIKTDYIHDSDGDEHNVDKCPICGDIDTFDYKYESIQDALKR